MPKMLEQTRQVSKVYRNLSISPDSINEEDRTFEVRFISDDNAGDRYGFYGEGWDNFGEFVEELGIERKHMRTERLESGNSPFLKDHNSSSIDNVLGTIRSIRFAKEGAYATIQFDDEGEEGIRQFKRVKNGTLRNVSVGYSVHRMEEIDREKRGDTTIPVMRVTDFEPFEISLVAIGFDGGANVRSEDSNAGASNPCTFLVREMEKRNMSTPKKEGEAGNEPVVTPGISEADAQARSKEAGKEAVKADRLRTRTIREQCQAANLSREFSEKLVDEDELTVAKANERIIEEFARISKENTPETPSGVSSVESNTPDIGRAIESAMKFRLNPRAVDAGKIRNEGGGDFFTGRTLVDMGREMLESNGIDTMGMERHILCERIMSFRSGSGAMHGSSDFPSLLEGLVNSNLRDGYVDIPSTWAPLATLNPVNDFKLITNLQIGEGQNPEIVQPGGEYPQATITEGKEQYSMDKRGLIYSFTWEMLVNDNLNAFARVATMLQNGQRRVEDDFFWNLLTSNPTLQTDGVAVFHASHNNLASVVGAPTVATLGAARSAMRKQTMLQGSIMNVTPVNIIIPTTLETDVDQLLASITSTKTDDVVPSFIRSLNVIVEPRLDADSTTAWYLSASTGQVDIMEEARLIGEVGPTSSQEEGFDVDSIKFKSRNVFGGSILDFRGLYKNVGA